MFAFMSKFETTVIWKAHYDESVKSECKPSIIIKKTKQATQTMSTGIFIMSSSFIVETILGVFYNTIAVGKWVLYS